MPGLTVIFSWLHTYEEFAKQYSLAREQQADTLAEECLEIADNSQYQTCAVDRLRIDARRWFVGKIRPSKYGDRPADVNISTTNNFVVLSAERLKELQDQRANALSNRVVTSLVENSEKSE